jgi:UDP-glucose 4-epimerase
MSEIEQILVTGGCGFIGANLVRFLREQTPWRVRVVDDLRTGKAENAEPPLAEVAIGNVADMAVLEPALADVDAVIHLASQTGVQPSVEDPSADFEGNTRATFRVLDACRRLGVNRLVFASSGAAVGEVPPPIHEEVVPKPVSPYGASKLACEAYCRAFASAFGMDTVALRFSNVYGPFSVHKKNAVPTFIKHCLTGEPIVIYGDGGQTRDFIHVDDLCDAILRAVKADGIGGEVFQVATGVETSIGDVARVVREVVGSETEIRFEEKRPGEVYRSRADIGKARRVLGFDPKIDLREGIRRTSEWYREHWLDRARSA